jgi:predicted amidohydrolase YtcJ
MRPEERISVEEALQVNTITGAYASREEAIKGSIEPASSRTFSFWQTILTQSTRTKSRTSRSCGP